MGCSSSLSAAVRMRIGPPPVFRPVRVASRGVVQFIACPRLYLLMEPLPAHRKHTDGAFIPNFNSIFARCGSARWKIVTNTLCTLCCSPRGPDNNFLSNKLLYSSSLPRVSILLTGTAPTRPRARFYTEQNSTSFQICDFKTKEVCSDTFWIKMSTHFFDILYQ